VPTTAKTSGHGFARSRSAYSGPDPIRAAEQLQLLQNRYKKWGSAEFDQRMLWITRKRPPKGEKDILPTTGHWNKNLVPFVHNRVQKHLDERMTKRNILLKYRQAGHTTYVLGKRIFVPTILEPGTNGLLISQNTKYATMHFRIVQRILRHFGERDPFDKSKNLWAIELRKHLLHTVVSNRKELIFDMLDSSIIIESAEVEEAGQGVTLHRLHCSEYARWPGNPEATLANVKEALVMDGTLDIESTPNGMGNAFHQEWLRAEQGISEFTAHFHEWWWHDEYRADEDVDPKTLTDEEKNLIRAKGIDLRQVGFRREKLLSLRHEFYEKYPEDSRSCFLTVTGTYFDNDVVKNRYLELQDKNYRPKGPGAFAEGAPWPDTYKKLEIYKNPIKHRLYIIGADVATGKPAMEGSQDRDWSAAWVLDQETGEQVASYRARIIPIEFAWELAELGRKYNDALIAVERNADGGTVIICLEINCQYMNLYKHKEWWKRGDQWKNTKYIVGMPTTQKTRPIALNRLQTMVMEDPELIYWKTFFEEAMLFVFDKNGKPAAQEGAHDDTVMAGAIAHYARAVRLGELDPLATPKEGYGPSSQDNVEAEEEPA